MKLREIILLQAAFLIYSIGSLFSKMSLSEPISATRVLVFYGLSLFFVMLFALIWQQLIKDIPLTIAYANKGITVLWGMLFGSIFFQEAITFGMVVGLAFVVTGITFMVKENE